MRRKCLQYDIRKMCEIYHKRAAGIKSDLGVPYMGSDNWVFSTERLADAPKKSESTTVLLD